MIRSLTMLAIAAVFAVALAGGVLDGGPPRAVGSAAVTLYDGTQQTGTSLPLDYNQSIPDLSLFSFNDKLSSISISGGWQISLYTAVNYSGTCVNVRSSVADLATLDVGDNSVSSLRFGQACSGPRSSYARLHHHGTTFATGVNIYDDTPDLRAVNANDTTSAITLHGLFAVAVYRDINYGGRCETIIPRNQGGLAGTTIGNDTISSIRLNYTCLGPVRQAPAIAILGALNNESNITDCPSTMTRRTKDLNDNADGNYIYACLMYGPFRPHVTYLRDLTVYNSGFAPATSSLCPGNNYRRYDVDLNDGANGSYVYFCVDYRETTSPSNAFSMRDIDFVWYDNLAETLVADILGDCRHKMGDHENASYASRDLNGDTSGDHIFTCTLGYSSQQDSIDPYLFLPTNLTAMQDPTNSQGTPVSYHVAAYDYRGTPLTVSCSPANFGAQGWFTLAQLGTTTVNCSTTDGDGRTASGSFQIELLPPPDTTPPTVSASGAPAGWTTTNPVVVTIEAADETALASITYSLVTVDTPGGGSPITQPVSGTTASITVDVAGDEIHTLRYFATDAATNRSATGTATIRIDTTAPTISLASRTPANGNGWNNADVTLSWTCTDSLSGPAETTVTETVSAEGANLSATGTCEDLAGNTTPDTQTGINIDRTAPTIGLDSRTPDTGNGWNNTEVDLEWSCADGLSGPVAATLRQTLSNEGANQSATGTCEDLAGNTRSDVQTGINIDKTAPTISFVGQTPSANANGWNRTDVALGWSCADSLSGLLVEGVVRIISTEGADLSATGVCEDLAGNSVSDTVGKVNIDKTAPTIAASAVTADGQPYTPGTWTSQDVVVSFTCQDALSGVATVTSAVTVATEGADQTVPGSCTDQADNAASTTFAGINVDKTAPTISGTISPGLLWPPNHELVAVVATIAASDNLSGASWVLVSVTSDEPDHGVGDDDQPNDIQGFAIGTAATTGTLRAERADGGDGRVYTLTYAATDGAGNTAQLVLQVVVPKNRAR